MIAERLTTSCCIAGGGPAGLMLGFLLARAGRDVVVLEKHADFLRDFRGDTIHPSTLELMYELGILDDFLKRPHQKVEHLTGMFGDTAIRIADFSHLPTHCRFIALMPQWEFLDFIAGKARRYGGFHLRMETAATGLIEDGERVAGVRARGPDGDIEIRAGLVVGADGRHSTMRAQAGLVADDLGAPMDVLWMRLSRRADDPAETFGRIEAGRMLVMLNRGDYWQCALVIRKGGYDDIRRGGFDAFRMLLAQTAHLPPDRVAELRGFDDIKLLTVTVDRLRRWHRPGLLCIGDAAHAMSPIGGVGINLAIQDAVAAANLLAAPLSAGAVAESDLQAVQRRRTFPTVATQWLQTTIQNRLVEPVLTSRTALAPPWPARLLDRWPLLQRIPARIVGLGVRPEHVRTAEVSPLT